MKKMNFKKLLDMSVLCPKCLANFKKIFQTKDTDGNLNLSELPKACYSCRKKMEDKMGGSPRR